MFKRSIRNAYPQCLALVFAFFSALGAQINCAAATPVPDATTENRHASIIHQALYDQFCATNLELLQRSAAMTKESSDAKDARIHFSDPDPAKSLAFIDRQCKLALNFAGDADSNVSNRARVLYYFGNMLHTLHDFYCHSNFVELKADSARAQGKELDPYNVELINWATIADSGVETGKHDLDKCSAESPEGAKKLGQFTYRKIADALAVRETERQWVLFQHLVQRKYGARSPAIIIALKHASCPAIDLSKLREELP